MRQQRRQAPHSKSGYDRQGQGATQGRSMQRRGPQRRPDPRTRQRQPQGAYYQQGRPPYYSSDNSPENPQRKRKPKRKAWKIVLIIVAIFIVLSMIISALDGPDEKEKGAHKIKNVDQDSVSAENTNDQVIPEQNKDSSQNAADDKEDIPWEYKSALKKAESYSEIMHMSKQGIYDQLTSEYGEKFAPEAAQYAIENMEANWNENALQKALTYSETMHMSKQGIYDQLVSENGEKFLPEEAQYAIEHAEIDWNFNAVKKAQSYRETMNMSPDAIYDQLVGDYGEKFTPEEAQFAIENIDNPDYN